MKGLNNFQVFAAAHLLICIVCNSAPIALAQNQVNDEVLRKELISSMVYVSGGTFMMGCSIELSDSCFMDALPRHVVQLSDFYISKYELTIRQHYQITGDFNNPFELDSLCPVSFRSYNEVELFLEQLNNKTGIRFRLPTEAEWEYAARGGMHSKGYKFSGSDTLNLVAWSGKNSRGNPMPVGKLRPNELGLYDLSGNVWEYCSDWYDPSYYENSDSVNPKGPTNGRDNVVRGGGCLSSEVFEFEPCYRFFNPGTGWYHAPGIRLVISAEDVEKGKK